MLTILRLKLEIQFIILVNRIKNYIIDIFIIVDGAIKGNYRFAVETNLVLVLL
jgi:hypothetical protein